MARAGWGVLVNGFLAFQFTPLGLVFRSERGMRGKGGWGRRQSVGHGRGWRRKGAALTPGPSPKGRGENGRGVEGVGDEAEFHEQFGGLAFGGDEIQMAGDHGVGVVEGGGQREGVGGGERHADVVADFEPDQMDEREPERAFEFAGGVEDEFLIGGGEDAGDRVADFAGQAVPVFAGREPIRKVRAVLGGCGGGRGRRFLGAFLSWHGGLGGRERLVGCVGICLCAYISMRPVS